MFNYRKQNVSILLLTLDVRLDIKNPCKHDGCLPNDQCIDVHCLGILIDA